MNKKTDVTNVQTVDVDMEELFGLPGASIVMTAGEEEADKKPKQSVFSSMKPDTKFLDKPGQFEPHVETEEEKAAKAAQAAGTETEEQKLAREKADAEAEAARIAEEEAAAAGIITDPMHPEYDASKDPANANADDKNKGGRPSTVISVVKKLIEKGTILPFDNDDKIEDYKEEDFLELLEMNFKNQHDELSQQLPEQFFQNMPVEMQQAYQYIANGGTDIKDMFRVLSSSLEARDLDPKTPEGQKAIIRSYLSATQFGTPEEIEDEIYSYEDRNELDKKANQFKPKLDSMQEQIVNKKLADQEAAKKLRQQQSQMYIDSVYNTLEKGQLNGLQIDNRVQNMLYAGLVQSNYPSISGRQTNMLGHLLEKYQWVEPNHGLIAEALWLLADPDGYRQSLATSVKAEVDKTTFRTLKTEQAARTQGHQAPAEPQDNGQRRTTRSLERPKKNFFSR